MIAVAEAEGRSVSSPVHDLGALEKTASATAAVILPKAFEDSPSTPCFIHQTFATTCSDYGEEWALMMIMYTESSW
jgi:hypothetical protein